MKAVAKPRFSPRIKRDLKKDLRVSALDVRSRWMLLLNLGLVVLIALMWGAMVLPDREEAPAVEATTTEEVPTPAAVQPEQPAAPAPETPAATPTGETYTVASGDSLASIGAQLGVPWQEIAEANNIEAPYALKVGQTLIIPR